METPLGLKVAHCELRFSKSGLIGVGVPERVNPSCTLACVAVAATFGPYEIRP